MYLKENSIYRIDSHVFVQLKNLIVLDLSANHLMTLPSNLPTGLLRLYLSHNLILFETQDDPTLPITELKHLDTLDLSDNKLKRFPKFHGSVPSLLKLNVTGNDFTHISVNDLGGLCQLRYLYVEPQTLFRPAVSQRTDKQSFCDCLEMERWVTEHYIQVPSFELSLIHISEPTRPY